MSCRDARESFSVLLAGKLRLTEWAEIEAHVRQCDGCGRALEQFYQVRPKEDAGGLRLPVRAAKFALGLAVCAAAAVLVAGAGGFAYPRRHDDQLTARHAAPSLEPLSPPAEPEAPPPVVTVSAPSAVPPAPATVTGSKTASRSAGPKSSPAWGTDVVVQLSAQDRREAERELTSLLARLGGSRLARDQRATMKVAVPRSRYGEFTRGLAQIGSWQMETRSPSLPDPVRVAVRLTR